MLRRSLRSLSGEASTANLLHHGKCVHWNFRHRYGAIKHSTSGEQLFVHSSQLVWANPQQPGSGLQTGQIVEFMIAEPKAPPQQQQQSSSSSSRSRSRECKRVTQVGGAGLEAAAGPRVPADAMTPQSPTQGKTASVYLAGRKNCVGQVVEYDGSGALGFLRISAPFARKFRDIVFRVSDLPEMPGGGGGGSLSSSAPPVIGTVFTFDVVQPFTHKELRALKDNGNDDEEENGDTNKKKTSKLIDCGAAVNIRFKEAATRTDEHLFGATGVHGKITQINVAKKFGVIVLSDSDQARIMGDRDGGLVPPIFFHFDDSPQLNGRDSDGDELRGASVVFDIAEQVPRKPGKAKCVNVARSHDF